MTDAVPATTSAMTNSPLPTDAPAPGAVAPNATAPNAAAPAVTSDQPAAAPGVTATTPFAAAPLPPERYDLALEGFTVDPALAQNAEPVLREIGLSNDAANKLLPVARDIMARTQDALLRQIEDAAAVQKKAWFDAFSADPEIGGARRGESEHLAARGLDALGFNEGHPFRQALSESGFGNHPDMIRAFRRLGEMLGEDGSFVRPATAPSRARPVWERLYPDETR